MNNYSNNICRDCPDRRVGCHNVDTCSKWAEHERKKKDEYDRRLLNCELTTVEKRAKAHFMRKVYHDKHGKH